MNSRAGRSRPVSRLRFRGQLTVDSDSDSVWLIPCGRFPAEWGFTPPDSAWAGRPAPMATKQPDQRRRDGDNKVAPNNASFDNRDGIAGDENDRQYPHTCKRDCGCGEIYLTRHTDDDGELTDEFAVVWRGQRLGRFDTANSASAVRDQLAK